MDTPICKIAINANNEGEFIITKKNETSIFGNKDNYGIDMLNLMSSDCMEKYNRAINGVDNTKTIMYHYTDLNGLLGILGNQCLWASNVNYMNDATEYKHGLLILEDVCKQIKLDHNDANMHLEGLLKYLGILKENAYSISFCEEPDLLSQWRGYANTTGVAIGFRKDKCWYGILEGDNTKKERFIVAKPVLYDAEFCSSMIMDLLTKYIEMCKTKYPYMMDGQFTQYTEAGLFLTSVIPFFKNKAFSEEKEWRIVIIEYPSEDKVDKSPVKFRCGTNLILPYVELKALDITKVNDCNLSTIDLPISEIVIGPSLNQELVENSINFFLKKRGIKNIQIKRSKIPYRS